MYCRACSGPFRPRTLSLRAPAQRIQSVGSWSRKMFNRFALDGLAFLARSLPILKTRAAVRYGLVVRVHVFADDLPVCPCRRTSLQLCEGTPAPWWSSCGTLPLRRARRLVQTACPGENAREMDGAQRRIVVTENAFDLYQAAGVGGRDVLGAGFCRVTGFCVAHRRRNHAEFRRSPPNPQHSSLYGVHELEAANRCEQRARFLFFKCSSRSAWHAS